MKRLKKILLGLSVIFFGHSLWARPSFSSVVAGSIGVDSNIYTAPPEATFGIPISAMASTQANISEWFTVRGEVEFNATAGDYPIYDMFTGGHGTVRIHELSAVFSRHLVTSTNFISVFFGEYEAIGTDTFWMRQFSAEPLSSQLVKSVTNISGVPLYTSPQNAGISYIVQMKRLPLATGGYAYVSFDEEETMLLNFDYRLGISGQKASLDFLLGLGIPLIQGPQATPPAAQGAGGLGTQFYLHGGINFILGNKYTSGFMLQAGFKRLSLAGITLDSLLGGDMLSLMLEGRLRFRNWGMNLNAYMMPQETIDRTLYLNDPVGIGITIYSDKIATKNHSVTVGGHIIASFGDATLWQLLSNTNANGIVVPFLSREINAYITPYAEIPLSNNSNLEVMAQMGALNLLSGALTFNLKVVVGFKKQF